MCREVPKAGQGTYITSSAKISLWLWPDFFQMNYFLRLECCWKLICFYFCLSAIACKDNGTSTAITWACAWAKVWALQMSIAFARMRSACSSSFFFSLFISNSKNNFVPNHNVLCFSKVTIFELCTSAMWQNYQVPVLDWAWTGTFKISLFSGLAIFFKGC